MEYQLHHKVVKSEHPNVALCYLARNSTPVNELGTAIFAPSLDLSRRLAALSWITLVPPPPHPTRPALRPRPLTRALGVMIGRGLV